MLLSMLGPPLTISTTTGYRSSRGIQSRLQQQGLGLAAVGRWCRMLLWQSNSPMHNLQAMAPAQLMQGAAALSPSGRTQACSQHRTRALRLVWACTSAYTVRRASSLGLHSAAAGASRSLAGVPMAGAEAVTWLVTPTPVCSISRRELCSVHPSRGLLQRLRQPQVTPLTTASMAATLTHSPASCQVLRGWALIHGGHSHQCHAAIMAQRIQTGRVPCLPAARVLMTAVWKCLLVAAVRALANPTVLLTAVTPALAQKQSVNRTIQVRQVTVPQLHLRGPRRRDTMQHGGPCRLRHLAGTLRITAPWLLRTRVRTAAFRRPRSSPVVQHSPWALGDGGMGSTGKGKGALGRTRPARVGRRRMLREVADGGGAAAHPAKALRPTPSPSPTQVVITRLRHRMLLCTTQGLLCRCSSQGGCWRRTQTAVSREAWVRGSIGGRRLLGTRPWAMAPLAGRAGTPSRRHRPSALVPAAALT